MFIYKSKYTIVIMNLDPPFDIIIYNEFLNLSEIIAISHTNKYYRDFCEKIIKKRIQNLNNVTVAIHRDSVFSKIYSFDEWEGFYKTYKNEYWYSVFGKQLNPELLAVYYANSIDKNFFIRNLLYDNKLKVYSLWKCIAYPDGYIKTLSKNDVENYSSTYSSEIIISIKIYISYIEKKSGYLTYITSKHDYIEIEYSYNFKTHNRIYIDEKVLQAYLSDKSYKCIYSIDETCKSNKCGKWCGNNNECYEIFNIEASD